MREIAVIGAGVVGLSTALSIQEAFPKSSITIFADKFNKDTLSNGAPGLFRPEINVHPDIERVHKWCKDSFAHFLEVMRSPEAAEAGMMLVSGFHLSSSSSQLENRLLASIVPEYQKLEEKELKMFPSFYKNGLFFSTTVTDCRYYLPWMESKFKKAGGKIICKHLSSLDEILDSFDVIVNCAGLGAKKIMNDEMVVPIRGQTIKVKAPWIKHFFYGDGVYIVPGVDYVTLGGIKDYGSWDEDVNVLQRDFILQKCFELVPSLKKAEILWDWVGLRPFRNSVRVDASFVACNGKHRMVVNNYGHGGHGITLSWGTAQDVVKIIAKLNTKKELLVSHI